MVILRRTKKLQSLLPATTNIPDCSDTALGDWYVNRITVSHQPLLLMFSSTSLFPMLLPARDVRSLPRRLASIVRERLKRLGIADAAIDAELQAMDPVVVRSD